MEVFKAYYHSPLGTMEIRSTNRGLISIKFVDEIDSNNPNEHILSCIHQLKEYFKGIRTSFTLELSLDLSKFQKKVLDSLFDIPHGTVMNYSALAKAIGQPDAVRAVAKAVGNNPLAIVIPCHRVIGKNGELRGYAWGKWRKEELLKHEC
ncbi:methylated-DNA--[protein]-cysteine S-methyltransferase [Halobacillus litoralis]|uniref:methylated-DNA--[protein]-cysteine S-methyltransferase n=1 Tax=Halobacillus litoralis TaxID=45668 RepID=A0A410ME66_9BACI|nr:methylated-DNA--[protein]-cysteine S-methyltransferase [Halobacillus litoralis]QAS52988.1 cysteine methyltransferase [Halobacillus litoralis]